MNVRVTQAPDIKTSASGNEWAILNVAHNEYQGKGKDSKAHYFRVKVFGKGVDMVRGMKPGDAINVEGDLQQEVWEKDGQKRYDVSIRSTWIRYLISKDREKDSTPSNTSSDQQGSFGGSEWGGPEGAEQAGGWDDTPF